MRLLEAAADPALVRIALAVGDEELAGAITMGAQRRHELNPNVPSMAGIAAHTRGLAAAGCTNRTIDNRLFISPHTVNTHLHHVFDKLGISSRVDLTRIADRQT